MLPQGRAKIDKAWFQDQMKERGLSLRRMASRMGMDPGALSRTLNGERRMQVDEIRKIADIFGTSANGILRHLGSSTDGRSAENTGAGHRGGFMEEQVDFKGATTMNSDNKEHIVAPRGADPLFGCMAGTLTLLPDVDYTAPADPDWGKVYDD
jgi:transcriptional regulator with XRE-family HTH domain